MSITPDPKRPITQSQLDKAMADHAPNIDDAKVTRADGTIDGAKLLAEMFKDHKGNKYDHSVAEQVVAQCEAADQDHAEARKIIAERSAEARLEAQRVIAKRILDGE